MRFCAAVSGARHCLGRSSACAAGFIQQPLKMKSGVQGDWLGRFVCWGGLDMLRDTRVKIKMYSSGYDSYWVLRSLAAVVAN